MAKKAPRKITPDRLQNIALHYLARYAASEAALRRVLVRRVDRALMAHGGDRAALLEMVEDLIGRLRAKGFLDDAAYAAGQSGSLRRRGASRRQILAKLSEKGVDRETAMMALAAVDAENDTTDLTAAIALARRRRLGPYRVSAEARADRRMKDMAALARAGFAPDVARRVIDAQTVEALEAEDGERF
ncbi:MAG: regulatory protein RecX [Magnetospiraceae bacterium]